ncbi:hypothetical protein FIU87_19230 [Bacillus sp. THAF10]|uniref:hypothetical protein n=1 Tax=Bacillus sp. THAF10 TaxID=2587848 RepID=UPI001269251B|nr:hypothetical protein [Bacillus sp. THAF10]QFT90782.1 hypothetical protein FIU87_19230 [Bacillus sp. THAF10]
MNKLLLFTFILTLFLTGCDPFEKEAMDFYQTTKSTNLTREHVQSISIHSNENEIMTVFGKPDTTEEIQDPKSTYLIYDDIEFGLKESKVFRYHFQRNHETSKGIAIGDKKDKVIREYGQHYYERVEGGNETVGYFDKDNRLQIEFGFQEDRVVTVIMEELE